MATATLASPQNQATLPLRRHMVEEEVDDLFARLRRKVLAVEREWDAEPTPYRELVRTLMDRYVEKYCETEQVLLAGIATFLGLLGVAEN